MASRRGDKGGSIPPTKSADGGGAVPVSHLYNHVVSPEGGSKHYAKSGATAADEAGGETPGNGDIQSLREQYGEKFHRSLTDNLPAASTLRWVLIFFGIGLLVSALALIGATHGTNVFDESKVTIFINFFRAPDYVKCNKSSNDAHDDSCGINNTLGFNHRIEPTTEEFPDSILGYITQLLVGAAMLIYGLGLLGKTVYRGLVAGAYYGRYVTVGITLFMSFWFLGLEYGLVDLWGMLALIFFGILITGFMWLDDHARRRDHVRYSVYDGKQSSEGGVVASALISNGAFVLEIFVYLIVFIYLNVSFFMAVSEDSALTGNSWVWALWGFTTLALLALIIVVSIGRSTFDPENKLYNPVTYELAIQIIIFVLVLVWPWIAFAGFYTQGSLGQGNQNPNP